jgi:hypothetical protein
MTVSELNTITSFTVGSPVAFQYPDRDHGGFKMVDGIVEKVAENKAGQAYVVLVKDGKQFRSYTANKIRFN